MAKSVFILLTCHCMPLSNRAYIQECPGDRTTCPGLPSNISAALNVLSARRGTCRTGCGTPRCTTASMPRFMNTEYLKEPLYWYSLLGPEGFRLLCVDLCHTGFTWSCRTRQPRSHSCSLQQFGGEGRTLQAAFSFSKIRRVSVYCLHAYKAVIR